MKIAILTMWRSLAIGLLVAAFSSVVFAGSQFSAEMLHQGPQGQVAAGKLFVGDKRVRVEMSSPQGQQVIRIADEGRGVEWILFPEQKKYLEQPLGGPGSKSLGVKAKRVEDPCDGMLGLTCRRLGEETIGGRPAVKWEMVFSQQEQIMKSTHWIDKERGIPLRQEMPAGGGTTELKLIAKEALDGRQVEKWELVATIPDRPETRTRRWFDPELELDIREEIPGGMVSELKNIRIGKQSDELFTIPAGYERVTAPTPPQGMPGSPPPPPGGAKRPPIPHEVGK